jgi:DNA repair protein RadC
VGPQSDPQRGHRQRACEKLIHNGHETMFDYEIIELMLFLVFKRMDTKPLAKLLIDTFGSIDKVLNASKKELLSIPGVGAQAFNAIKIIDAVVKSSLKSKILNKNTIECFEDVVKYCKVNMKNLISEEFRILFLNGMNEVIQDEIVQKGSVDAVNVYPREIVRRCIENGAKGFIMVHNHPSGDPTPSANDIYTTKKIKEAADIFNIDLQDHIIIGGDKYISFRSLRIIK